MTTIVHIHAQLQWNITPLTSGGYMGVCDPLNLTLEGDTLDDLATIMNEGVHLLLGDLLKENELDSFLRQHKWNAQGIPTRVNDEVRFDLPPPQWIFTEKMRDLSYLPN